MVTSSGRYSRELPVATQAAVDAGRILMRVRAVTGIAYRLALVAAGEGELDVSLNGPRDWDYAGGQALLLGAGADLFDARGRPVTYSPEGRCSCAGACFGGPPALVAESFGRHWHSALDTGGALRTPIAGPGPAGRTLSE